VALAAAGVLASAGAAAASSPGRLGAARAPSASPAAANGRIAFSQWDLLPGGNLSGHSNVFTISPGGSGRRQLTHVGAAKAAGAPDWSADGAKIVYESNQSGDYRIWVMNADGSGQRRLTGDPGFADLEPAWSPDGKRILFSRCDDHLGFITFCDLEVVNAAGGGMRQLASGHWTYVRGQYSPDGRRIVVGADRGGLLSALWVMRADGSGLHRITRPSLQAFWPGWSPDGRRIVFTDNCCQFGSNIWTVRPNGHGLTELTHFGPAPLQGAFASYAPDGRRIVLQYNGKCPARGICPYFYVMNADGSGLRAVHTGVANTFLTDWGPAA
jgi:Tol biopolymer transport system component